MPGQQQPKRDYLLLAIIAIAVSIASLIVYYRHDAILLYGDAVAHINIARRVFDSRRPGPSQFGTVWLPLPHVLMLPFIISNWAWRTGLGGSLPSMAGYIAGVLGVFRLLRRGLVWSGVYDSSARLAAWFGALVYAANPNLIYMQTTAMGESLYLAFFIWAVVFFTEFVAALHGRADETGRAARSLRWCGAMLLCAMLCRYDGWFVAAGFGVAVVIALLVLAARGNRRPELRGVVRSGVLVFVLLVAAAPMFWLAWNKAYFGNALEWMNGPYSARAIMERSIRRGEPPHPGYHDVKTAMVYYVKCAKLNLAGNNLGWGGARYGWPRRVENVWPILAALGTLLILLFARGLWPLLLLWIPLVFYAISIAYGGVPIFMPVWWPFSYYNVRYGLQMLPLAAVMAGLTLGLLSLAVRKRAFPAVLALAALASVAVSYASIWKSGPVCLHEAEANSTVRIALERRVGAELQNLPPDSTLLMQLGYYVGVLERAGIPLKRTINETDYKLWQAALDDPAHHADYLVAAGDDRVAATARAHGSEFVPIASFEAEGQPSVVVYGKKAGEGVHGIQD